MKWRRLLVVLALVLLILAIAGWLALHLLVNYYVTPALSHAELRERAEMAMKEAGGADVLGKEAKAILFNYRARANEGWAAIVNGGKDYSAVLTLSSLLCPHGHDLWVVADKNGLPAHIVIRFGSHAHYAYIWMFDSADMPLGKIEGVEHLGGTVYLAEKNE